MAANGRVWGSSPFFVAVALNGQWHRSLLRSLLRVGLNPLPEGAMLGLREEFIRAHAFVSLPAGAEEKGSNEFQLR